MTARDHRATLRAIVRETIANKTEDAIPRSYEQFSLWSWQIMTRYHMIFNANQQGRQYKQIMS